MDSWKLETHVAQARLPQFLRELAQALESGRGQGALAGLPPLDAAHDPAGGLRKLVLVAEAREQGFRLKLKAKRAGELRVLPKPSFEAPGSAREAKAPKTAREADASARAQEKYRQLKKALQADYKALKRAAEAGVMPAQDVLESFLGLSEAMVDMEQPGQGPGRALAELAQAGRSYLEDARALRRAVSARDAAALTEVLARLERRKSACHAQFR